MLSTDSYFSRGGVENKVCLVTGAARGIGKAIVNLFAENKAIVYANARQEGVLDGWSRELSDKYHTKVIPVYFDVIDTKALTECYRKIKNEYGTIDVLINNAGMLSNERIGVIKEDTVKKLFSTNVFAVIQSLQLAARLMMKQKSGSIINISSIVGTNGAANELVYSGTKGAVIAITKSASKELAKYGIRVNSIAPGYVDTDMFQDTIDKAHENTGKYVDTIGLGRLAKSYDIAEACLFLASDSSSYITGQILGVDGGAVL